MEQLGIEKYQSVLKLMYITLDKLLPMELKPPDVDLQSHWGYLLSKREENERADQVHSKY